MNTSSGFFSPLVSGVKKKNTLQHIKSLKAFANRVFGCVCFSSLYVSTSFSIARGYKWSCKFVCLHLLKLSVGINCN